MKSIITAACLSIMIVSLSSSVYAATLVETEDSREGVQKMWIEGKKMRMNTGKGKEYVIADYAKGEVIFVNPDDKELIVANPLNKDGANSTKGLNVRVKHMGGGPNIAGYPTQKYALIVNGRTCNTTLVSAKALKDTNMGPLLESMAKLDFNPMGTQFMSECDRAELMFAKRLRNLGLPLGTMEMNGQIRDKVRRIVKNAELPPGGFSTPKGYRKVTMQQKMQEAMGGQMPGAAGMPPATGMPPGADGQMNPEMQKMIEDMMRQQGR